MNIAQKQRACGLLSSLLQYPDAAWREQLPPLREEAEAFPDAVWRRVLAAFLDRAEAAGERDWQDQYVQTFDFGKKTNLYLTYARHGEERERGTALLALKRRYAEAGFELAGCELPDYLPLMLEFASAAAWDAAADALAGSKPALAALRDELAGMGSPYAPLFERLLQIVPDGPATLPATDAAPAGRERM